MWAQTAAVGIAVCDAMIGIDVAPSGTSVEVSTTNELPPDTNLSGVPAATGAVNAVTARVTANAVTAADSVMVWFAGGSRRPESDAAASSNWVRLPQKILVFTPGRKFFNAMVFLCSHIFPYDSLANQKEKGFYAPQTVGITGLHAY